MRLFQQILLIASTMGFSWLAMMVFHELGHVLHAWASGGTVARVVLQPLAISRTDYVVNPYPLVAAWGGAIWGSLLPVAVYLAVRGLVPVYAYLARFFAGFCLIANGAYLGVGSFFVGGGDDAGLILEYGGRPWQMRLFGVAVVGTGLWLWNGLGPKSGLGEADGHVDGKAAWGMAVAVVVVVGLEMAGNWMW